MLRVRTGNSALVLMVAAFLTIDGTLKHADLEKEFG